MGVRCPVAFPVAFVAALVLATAACKRRDDPEPAAAVTPTAPTNRIAIPAAVRQNLGLTFARVERRAVARTLRLPGRFELLPTARREYRVPTAGRVDVLVEQYQSVEAGEALYRLDAPRWRELQDEITSARADVSLAEAASASMDPLFRAHEQHHDELQRTVTLWSDRVDRIEQMHATGIAKAEELAVAKAALASARSNLAETLEKEAELAARRVEVTARREAALARFEFLIASASALTGISHDELLAELEGGAFWQRLTELEVKAIAPGVVDDFGVTSGAWTEDNALALVIVQPERVRFRARALQSDLGRLAGAVRAAIVAPTGGSLAAAPPIPGTLQLAPTADADRRTIDLLVTPAREESWARAGVSAFVEITFAGSDEESLAIPLASVVRDGLAAVIFRRDPQNPDQVIRIEADLGGDDGRWVAIASGVREGDEVVRDGVYPLLIATSGTISKGGHFHPDGSFHEGDQ